MSERLLKPVPWVVKDTFRSSLYSYTVASTDLKFTREPGVSEKTASSPYYRPGGDEDPPVEEEDEDQRYEECGTRGKYLVGYILAHLGHEQQLTVTYSGST